jgi:hypothetical protein
MIHAIIGELVGRNFSTPMLFATNHFIDSSMGWFFIEYWIKNGVDFNPAPLFYF